MGQSPMYSVTPSTCTDPASPEPAAVRGTLAPTSRPELRYPEPLTQHIPQTSHTIRQSWGTAHQPQHLRDKRSRTSNSYSRTNGRARIPLANLTTKPAGLAFPPAELVFQLQGRGCRPAELRYPLKALSAILPSRVPTSGPAYQLPEPSYQLTLSMYKLSEPAYQ
jgi:hypothetical protein